MQVLHTAVEVQCSGRNSTSKTDEIWMNAAHGHFMSFLLLLKQKHTEGYNVVQDVLINYLAGLRPGCIGSGGPSRQYS